MDVRARSSDHPNMETLASQLHLPEHCHHIDLTTGHVAHSGRSEAAGLAVAMCKDVLLEGITTGEPQRIPGTPRTYTLFARRWSVGADHPALVADLEWRGRLLYCFGVGNGGRAAQQVWSHLHAPTSVLRSRNQTVVTSASKCPPAPWCGKKVAHGSFLPQFASTKLAILTDRWVSKFECALAWAWISMNSPSNGEDDDVPRLAERRREFVGRFPARFEAGPHNIRNLALQPIPLGAICAAVDWHLASAVEALQSAGLERPDAEAFAAFAFADRAEARDDEPMDLLSDEQRARLVNIGGIWAVRR